VPIDTTRDESYIRDMTRLVNDKTSTRRYRSELRAQQVDDTRSRILEAALRVMADGFASVSIPNVAREAGVSVPTVYRHFRTKQDLLDALYPYLIRRSGLTTPPPPQTVAEIRQGVIAYLEHLDSLDDFSRAVLASPASDETRARSMARRFDIFRPAVESIEAPISKADRDRILRLIVLLTSSPSLRLLHDHLGASTEDVAEDIDWFVRAAVAAASGRAGS
jgi:AcrR family transcriptional regulator